MLLPEKRLDVIGIDLVTSQTWTDSTYNWTTTRYKKRVDNDLQFGDPEHLVSAGLVKALKMVAQALENCSLKTTKTFNGRINFPFLLPSRPFLQSNERQESGASSTFGQSPMVGSVKILEGTFLHKKYLLPLIHFSL